MIKSLNLCENVKMALKRHFFGAILLPDFRKCNLKGLCHEKNVFQWESKAFLLYFD